MLAGLLTKSLNALLLGEGYARTLGVNLTRVRAGIVLATAVLAGVVTAFAGPVGFIGIVVPSLKDRPNTMAALSAGLVAVLASSLPYKLGLMLATLTGIAVGVWLENRKK